MFASATACFAKTGISPLRLAILHLADGSLSCRLGERNLGGEDLTAEVIDEFLVIFPSLSLKSPG